MMLARFLGEGDADVLGVPQPCHVYGLDFPVGEWVMVENPAHAAKLAGNPLFDTDGDVPAAPKLVEPEPEPDPEADDESGEREAPDTAKRVDAIRAALTAKGIPFHHKTGEAKLAALLAEQA